MTKWVINSLHNVHSYQIVRENRQAITVWLAKYYMKEFRDQPNWPKEAMRRTFRRDLGQEFKDVKLRIKRFAKIHTKVLHQTIQRPMELLSYHTRKKPRFILQGKSKSIESSQQAFV